MFDNRFFGTSPAAEAGVMDPLQRLLIERRYSLTTPLLPPYLPPYLVHKKQPATFR